MLIKDYKLALEIWESIAEILGDKPLEKVEL